MTWQGRNWRVGKAFIGEPVAVRADGVVDGVHAVVSGLFNASKPQSQS